MATWIAWSALVLGTFATAQILGYLQAPSTISGIEQQAYRQAYSGTYGDRFPNRCSLERH